MQRHQFWPLHLLAFTRGARGTIPQSQLTTSVLTFPPRQQLHSDSDTCVFENTSPQRPLTWRAEPRRTDTVDDDELFHSHTVVNFSRKRSVRDGRGSNEQASEHGSKRHRHADWPEELAPARHEPVADEQVLSPARQSKFREASMTDRPSEKPPSMFTRNLDRSGELSMDDLMTQYHARNDKPLPPHPSAFAFGRDASSPERKRQSAQPAASTFSRDTQDDEGRGGGIFKLGKSMASAFNPLNVWFRFTTGWRVAVAKEDLEGEADVVKKKQELERQKSQAALVYAQMKQSGSLGGLGAHHSGAESATVVEYAKSVEKEGQRDSRISINASSRSSRDPFKRSSIPAAGDSPNKGPRHYGTSSFHDLKRVASAISLRRRSTSTSRSPEKEDVAAVEDEDTIRLPWSKSRGNVLELFGPDGAFGSGRESQSRSSLTEELDEFGTVRSRKQAKLTKRVSDLEAKLESARRELERALGTAPPVPSMTPIFKRRPLPRPERDSSSNRGFMPVLPTLLSESLLLPSPGASEAVSKYAELSAKMELKPDADETSVIATELSIKDEPPHGSAGNSLDMQRNEPLLKGDITGSPPAKESVPKTREREGAAANTALEPPAKKQRTTAEGSSPPSNSSNKTHKTSNKKKKKDKHSKVDKTYRPGSESNADDDAEWNQAQKQKPKRKSDQGMEENGHPKRVRISRLDTAPTPSPEDMGKRSQQRKSTVLRGPSPAAATGLTQQTHKDLPLAPLNAFAVARTSLDTVHEETGSFTIVIPAMSGAPRKPTAKPTGTTTTFDPYRSPNMESNSPSVGSTKRKRKVLTPKSMNRRKDRSLSPPPSSARFGTGSAEHEEDVAHPNDRQAPPSPRSKRNVLKNKSSFEWPEDVF